MAYGHKLLLDLSKLGSSGLGKPLSVMPIPWYGTVFGVGTG
jgi:hypothetical protein